MDCSEAVGDADCSGALTRRSTRSATEIDGLTEPPAAGQLPGMRTRSLPALAAVVILLAGCASTTSAPPARRAPTQPPASDQAPLAIADRPIASTRDGEVMESELRPALIELAGATVLRDALLDRRIVRTLADRGIVLAPTARRDEEAILLASLDPDPNAARRLLDDIRARQGLGPVRYEALLVRNAGLRALVQADVRITEDALARQHEAMFGERRVCRVVAHPSLSELESIRAAVAGGASFGELAAQRSTDRSAERGGLLAPIARTDPSWPETFREALFRLGPNEMSPPISVDAQYLLVQLVEIRPGDGSTLAARRDEVERSLRRAQERVLMEELARTLLGEIRPTFYDSAFQAVY